MKTRTSTTRKQTPPLETAKQFGQDHPIIIAIGIWVLYRSIRSFIYRRKLRSVRKIASVSIPKPLPVRNSESPRNQAEVAKLTPDQKAALELLNSPGNYFLSGGAGTGKSFLTRALLESKSPERFPIVASTGAAAILVGGKTFHSFFGLGIMEGGAHRAIGKALKNQNVWRRIQKADGVLIDEVSMIPGEALRAAETISRTMRDKSRPWGGLKVIAVGDFSQLPPVAQSGKAKDWAFLNRVWEVSNFKPVLLTTTMRTQDAQFLDVLNCVRSGVVNADVSKFLNSRRLPENDDTAVTRLYPTRARVDHYNKMRLETLPGNVKRFETQYTAVNPRLIDTLKKNAPISEIVDLKDGALVMLRTNDPDGRWVNGSLGIVHSIYNDRIAIALLNGHHVEIERFTYSLLDGDGEAVASARNFPLTLAYATTIHKSQGMTLDRMRVDLCGAWEHGQVYVALSRVRTAESLFIDSWSPATIVVDEAVRQFHRRLARS